MNRRLAVLAALATIIGTIYTIASFYKTKDDQQRIRENTLNETTPNGLQSSGKAKGSPQGLEKHRLKLDGQWEFSVQIEKGITSSGNLIKRNDSYELIIQLSQDGRKITGRYIAASNGMCGNASLVGWIEADSIRWSISYVNCGNIKKEFIGKIIATDEQIKIEGNTTPTSAPDPGSWAGYEKMIGFQTSSRKNQ